MALVFLFSLLLAFDVNVDGGVYFMVALPCPASPASLSTREVDARFHGDIIQKCASSNEIQCSPISKTKPVPMSQVPPFPLLYPRLFLHKCHSLMLDFKFFFFFFKSRTMV